jgi:adenylate kinase
MIKDILGMADLLLKRLVFLGAPGAGKGTQAKIVSDKYGIPSISTGDILRAAIKAETPLGKTAKSYVESGGLVPDEVVIGIIEERLKESDCANGYILDGFPRTVGQAEALDSLTGKMNAKLDGVIYFEVETEELVKRLSGRRVCRACGATYHMLFKAPKVEGVCDACGGELYQRADDSAESVRNRLQVYDAQTAPLIEYYKERGLLKTVAASGSIDEIFERLSQILEGSAS